MKRFTQSILALLFAGASLQAAPVDDLPQKRLENCLRQNCLRAIPKAV